MQPARTLNFRPSGDLVGDWDPGRLRQVLTNLIGNAFEHGAADEPVELAVVAAGANAILRVHNQGPPIPSDLLPSIFEPLVRRSTLEPAEGSVSDSVGLGLYIVRQIVVAHGGSIEVDSGEQGTTFTIRLPIQGSDGKGEAAR
jgi:signal transduction histidine kinase